jgi:protein-S-isoprenylcysteine O-methyltransferase Ste14
MTVFHLAAVVLVGWLLLGGGLGAVAAWRRAFWPEASTLREWFLFACALIYFLRVSFTVFYLIKRKMGWGEALLVALWVSGIHILFAYFGGRNPGGLGWAEWAGVILYTTGSFLNTGSETQRKWWKERPENKGRLYMGGLFRYATHINYFGDELLFTGYALLTGIVGMLIVPLVMMAGFVFFNIPELDKYLREHYGAEFDEYSRRTKKFAPFVY